MPSNEGHVHFNYYGAVVLINYADQDMELVPGGPEDPNGSVYVRAMGSPTAGLHIPTVGWEAIPGTSPTLEGRADAHDPVGYLRIRIA